VKKLITQQLFLALCLCYCIGANAQKTLIDTIPPKSAATSSSQLLMRSNLYDDTANENKLVRLAIAQPGYKQTDAQNKILEYQLKKQRSAWLNLLSISATYNDQTFAKNSNSGPTAYVYPKYFFGVTIPLGLIASNKSDIKITEQSQTIATEQQAELAKSIKADVLKNYKQYKANEKLLIIENQIVDDEQANFLQIEQKFKEGTVSLDAYNDASKKYNDEVVKAINLQLDEDMIKVELERLIGMSLEDALK
jgi:outer membrane protein TolC